MHQLTNIILLISLVSPGIAFAQAFSPSGLITDRPSAKRLPPPKYTPPASPQGFELPSVTPPATGKPVEEGPLMTVERFQFKGNTVFTEQTLEAIAAPYLNRPIIAAELYELRHKLTQLYVDNGYINSGAILPKQVFKEGIINFEIIEGELTDIRVTGHQWLNPDYISDRLSLGAGPPLNDRALQDQFQLLLTDPLIESMDGRLLPGVEPGQSILDVKVSRARPYQLSFSADNHRSPSTGAESVSSNGWVRNLSGFGDLLGFSVAYGEGRFAIDAAASVPINRYDTVLGFRYANAHSSVIEEPLDTIDIDNRFRSFEVSLIQPVYRTLERQFSLSARVESRKSRNTLLGRPFSFSLGEENGESKVTPLRLSQEFTDSRLTQVVSFRSTFSVGLKAFDATWHSDDRPDGNYFSWLGQFQYAYQLLDNGTQIRLRGSAQFANDELLPLEQYAVGGVYSVRGYRENELVRDQGFATSVEFHVPLIRESVEGFFPGRVEAIPFMDYGGAWNVNDSKNILYLHGIGIGLRWIHRHFSTEVFYAHDLNQAVEKSDYNLQDASLYFRVTALLF